MVHPNPAAGNDALHDYVVVTMSGILVLLVVLALLAAFGVWKHLRDGRMRAHSASTPHLPAERIGEGTVILPVKAYSHRIYCEVASHKVIFKGAVFNNRFPRLPVI